MTVFSRNSVASPEALANIPQSTIDTWPTGLVPLGRQPSERYGVARNGKLIQHAIGCRINGGPLQRFKCGKCRECVAVGVVGGPQPIRARSAETKR